MKRFLPFILSLAIFLFSASMSYAYDLEVQCDRSKCDLSSKDAIFSSGQMWRPGMSVEKDIVLKNVDGERKDIYFDVKSYGSEGELDKYILLSFSDPSGELWSGALEDLIGAKRIFLTHLDKGASDELRVMAIMDMSSPNSIQGSSSSFDFRFGFEGEQSDSEANGSENSSDSSSRSGTNTTTTSLGEVLTGIFVGTTQKDLQNTSTVGNGARSSKEVSGANTFDEQSCRDNFWIWVLALQVIFGTVVAFKRKRQLCAQLVQAALFALAALLIYFIDCRNWSILLAILIFLVSHMVMRYKNFFADKFNPYISFK